MQSLPHDHLIVWNKLAIAVWAVATTLRQGLCAGREELAEAVGHARPQEGLAEAVGHARPQDGHAEAG
eukprot:253471-Alexandrium_andersonii.AAC.1